jgi:RNA polymerase sigma factor (sigma-70 family)
MAPQDDARANLGQLKGGKAKQEVSAMNAHNVDEALYDPKAATEETLDAFSAYQRDVETRKRMSRDEERRVAEEIVACRDDIVTTLRDLILEAGDAVGLDPAAIERLRAELTQPSSGKKLESLQAPIEAIVYRARQASELLRKRKRCHSSDAVRAARALLGEIARGFGVTPATLESIATEIAAKRQRIAMAKQRLVEANLRLVLYFARKMKWQGVDTLDLVQEGNIALLRAVDAYDPKRGFSFASFACTAIRRAMTRFGSTASRPVHVPAEVRARRSQIRKAEMYLTGRDGTPPSWETVAEYLGLTVADVVDALGDREEALPLEASGDDEVPIISRLADPSAPDVVEFISFAEVDRQARDTVANLEARDRRVIESRFSLDNAGTATLAEIGRNLGVTRERARQLEARALRELRSRGSGSGRRQRRRSRSGGRHTARAS